MLGQNARRRDELEGTREVLAAERSATLGHLLPDVLRNCSLRHDRLAFDLAVERHIRHRSGHSSLAHRSCVSHLLTQSQLTTSIACRWRLCASRVDSLGNACQKRGEWDCGL